MKWMEERRDLIEVRYLRRQDSPPAAEVLSDSIHVRDLTSNSYRDNINKMHLM